MPDMNGNKYTITVGVNPNEIPQYKDDIQKQLNTLSKDLKISPILDDAKLKSQLTALKGVISEIKSEQLINVNIAYDKIESQLSGIATKIRSQLSGMFDFGGADNALLKDTTVALQQAEQMLGKISETTKALKISFDNINTSLAKVDTSIKKYETSTKDTPTVTNRLKSSLNGLYEAFQKFSSLNPESSKLDDALVNITNLVSGLSDKLKDKPLQLKIHVPANAGTLYNIKQDIAELNKAILSDPSMAIRIKATPEFLVAKDGNLKPLDIPGKINEKYFQGTVKAAVDAINANPSSIGFIKLHIDQAFIKEQTLKAIEFKISNFELIKTQLNELSTLAKDVQRKINAAGQSPKRTSSKAAEPVDKTVATLSPAILQPLSEAIGSIMSSLSQIVGILEAIREKGIAVAGTVKDVTNEAAKAAKKAGGTQQQTQDAKRVSDEYNKAKAAMDQYLAIKKKLDASTPGTEQHKYYKNEAASLKAVYESAKKLVTIKKELQNLDSIFTAKDSKNTRDINEKRAYNLQKVKEFAQDAQVTLSALDKDYRLASQKAQNTGLFKDAGFVQYTQNINEMKSLVGQMSTMIKSGNFDGNQLIKLKQRFDDLSRSNKSYISILNELNSDLSMTDKNFDKLENTAAKLSRYMNEYGGRIKKNTDLYRKFAELQNLVFNKKIGNNEASRRLNQLTMEARAAGIEADTLWHKLKRTFAGHFRGRLAYSGWFMMTTAIRQVYKNVVELDTAMTELRKVTNETERSYIKFLDNAEVRAKKLGATLVDTVSATADMARLGYNLEDAALLADVGLIYKNVGDGVDNIDDATASVISTMQAFGIQANDAMSIIDKFNAVGNNFATTSGDIGVALQKSASAMESANNSLDQTIALYTAAQTTVQDADVVGTALKTLSLRIRGAKSDLEDAGLETEGMAESTSKLRDEIKALTGVDIMIDDTTFKSTYDILKEISKVWDQISDVSQANVLELLFAKRQANIGSAILKDFDIAEKALKTAAESTGSALKENEIYLESIQGRLDKLAATWQSLSSNMLNSDVVKGAVTGANALLDTINTIVKNLGMMPTLIGAIGAAWARHNNIGKECALLLRAA
jgi:TP901 family phage tail tape measure protein